MFSALGHLLRPTFIQPERESRDSAFSWQHGGFYHKEVIVVLWPGQAEQIS